MNILAPTCARTHINHLSLFVFLNRCLRLREKKRSLTTFSRQAESAAIRVDFFYSSASSCFRSSAGLLLLFISYANVIPFSFCRARISRTRTREFSCVLEKKTKAAVTKKARRAGKVYFLVGKSERRRGALNNFHTLHRWQICGAKNKSATPQQHGAHIYIHQNNLRREPFATAAGPNLIFPAT